MVILCHSSYSDSASGIADYELAWLTIENHYPLWQLIPTDQWPRMLPAFPGYMHKAWKRWITGTGNPKYDTVYSRQAFNAYGDIALARTEHKYEWVENSNHTWDVGEHTVQRISSLNEFCEARGATLVIAGYPIGDGKSEPNRQSYIQAWEQLKDSVSCPVISDIEDYLFDPELFYDTFLHLTDAGTQLRTEQLIADIKNWQQSQ